MFAQLLALHWKAARWFMLPLVLLCFGLPQLAVRTAESVMEAGNEFAGSAEMLSILQGWLPLFPLLALLSGVFAGLTAWTWDHGTRHVYALSLPVSRREYALLKLSAGAVVLLLPTLAILAGLLMVALLADIPEGLRIYAFSFTTRFLLASMLSYALLFALAAGTMRTTIYLGSAFVIVLVFGSIFTSVLEDMIMQRGLLSPVAMLHHALVNWAGPFSVFGGSWMFIDV
jgi:hypothetical protein